MKTRKTKKGFTIVELVIVIAVIGILAAILIPTFISLSDKARRASDDSLVANLNKSLAAQEQDPKDKKNETMHNAVEDLELWGYKLPELVAKSGRELLWNSKTNRFVLSDAKEVEDELAVAPVGKATKYWQLVSAVPAEMSEQKFSMYPSATWQGATSVDVEVGFDAGRVDGIASINYTSSLGQSVVIRTNSANTTLTIDAEHDTIHHYDALGALNIVKANTASYHENGKVAYVEIAYGRIVLESGSKVEEIHVNKKTDSSFDTVIIANNGGEEELPDRITRDAVTVSEETLVVKVESNGSSENVYVYAEGATGKTNKVTEGENKQNENVNSPLGQLVLDNGANPGEKAQTAEEKQAAKEEAVEEAVVEEIEKDDKYVARIGTTPFESLKDAVAGAVADDVIEMTANDLSTENISVNKVLTIRMNEKTFGGTIIVATTGTNAVTVVGQANVDAVIKLGNRYFNAFVTANNGTVTLMKDITMSQIYKHDYSGTAKNWGVDLNGHTITLTNNNSEGGVYVGSYYGTNHTLSFSNGNLVFTGTSSSSVAMEVYGNLDLNNVNVTSSCGTAIKTEAGYWDGPAHVTITGGSIVSQGKGLDLEAYKSGTTIKQSTAVLTNVTISAKNEGVKSNGASCTIESCSISSTNSHAVSTFNSSSGSNPSQVIISGNSSIAASSAHAINCTSGTLQISGNAELTGTVYVQSSAMTIAGGVYHGNFSLGGSGQLTIAGGTYNGNLIDVTEAGRLLVIGETQFEELVTYSITGSNGSYEVVAQ